MVSKSKIVYPGIPLLSKKGILSRKSELTFWTGFLILLAEIQYIKTNSYQILALCPSSRYMGWPGFILNAA